MRKNQFLKILFLVLFWLAADLFIVSYERVAIVQDLHSLYGMKEVPYGLAEALGLTGLVAVIGSAVVASLDILFLTRLLRRKPLGVSLTLRTSFYLVNIFTFASIAIILSIGQRVGEPATSEHVFALYGAYVASPRMLTVMLYWGFVTALGLLLLEVNDKFGPGVLINLLRGKYHSPREEERTFMFLDLTSSTTYAETLGHFRYSRLLQDCFYDLTEVVTRNRAEVYQYVGDEVVLTWKEDDGVKDNRCVSTFFEYQNAIRNRDWYYRGTYGIIPEFKAGLNVGRVTVAEVGEIKRELAYHGDALNTTARVRSLCIPKNERLLITGDLLSALPHLESAYAIQSHGEAILTGKNRSVRLFGVRARSGGETGTVGDRG